jgi:uncharacterized protein YndB with AHSA1/START domain
MIRFEIEIPVEIDRPVHEVFAYVTDPSKLPEWQTNTLEATPEQPGPLHQGSRVREVHKAPFGKRVRSVVEVARLEPDRAFDLRMVEGPLAVHGDHRFADSNGATRLDVTIHGEAPRLMTPVLRRQFKRHFAELKRRLEAS